MPPSSTQDVREDSDRLVLARAKAAIVAGDQVGALALLHALVTEGPEVAATLTPVLAQALIATARAHADEQDRLAREAYQQTQAARSEIVHLLRGTPFDAEDLQAIREVLDERERELQDQLQQRLADQEGQGGNSTGIRRLGVGWLERYWVERRWGPYLRLRWRDGLRKRMKYIGKVESK